MPSPLPSSFASAAAGSNQDSSKRDGGTGGEWTRSRMNGATQTFRRPSVATNAQNRESSQTTSASTPTSAAYIPANPSSNTQARNPSTSDARYSKDKLLEIFKNQRDSGSLGKNLTDFFVANWNPLEETSTTNGAIGKDNPKGAALGAEVCWDHAGQFEPLGLTELTDDEKELFSTTVNSPLKPPPSAIPKDGASGIGGRKTSFSNAYMSSPSSGRTAPRRRETADSSGNPMSPSGGGSRFFRDEPNTTTPPPALLRRKTDYRDPTKPEEKDKPRESIDTSPFGGLKRSATNPAGSLTGATPSWSTSASQTAGFSAMGAFGSFSLGPPTSQSGTTEKRPGYGSVRGESRFKGLLSKESSEDVNALARDKGATRSTTESGERAQSPWGETLKTRPSRSETNPFGEEPRAGSAALGGSQEAGSAHQGADDLGFGAFGMTPGVAGIRDLLQSRDSHDVPSHLQGLEPTSPTNTNPYQSPRGDKGGDDDVETDGSDVQRTQIPGLRALREDANAASFGGIRHAGSGLDLSAGDRSQTSSAGPGKNFPSLGGLGSVPGLGNVSGWPSSGAIGTPTRERAAFSGFGETAFSTAADMQSPTVSTLGGGGFFGSHGGLTGTGSIGRSSKMGSLFPPSMQEQMHGDAHQDASAQQAEQAISSSSAPASQHPVTSAAGLPTTSAPTSDQVSQSQSSSGAMPVAQQRTMVMPDRMRWIYRDPQGNIQGPWSGLEMHDWFKAGFFTADLQVKRLEDPDFEPLGQLVRRIGNSREPFLVPQIGIPHGPEPTTTGSQPGTAQPPFANSFPTFGTTLTAEQQNALERRKQEEQYLIAQQKELARHQALMKQMQMQSGPHVMHPQLQHHSSAHSLHSQPSFGSITSPGGYQPSPIQGPLQPPQAMPNYFDSMRPNAFPGLGPHTLGTDLGGMHGELPDLLGRLNVSRPDPYPFGAGQGAFGGRPQESSSVQPNAVATMLQERARLQQEQELYDRTHGDSIFEQQAREERLRQFHALRSQDGEFVRGPEGLPTHPAPSAVKQEDSGQQSEEKKETPESSLAKQQEEETNVTTSDEPLSLSEQVQKAAAAQKQQQQQQQQRQQQQKQAAGETATSQPTAPPPSSSPLPAPAAQRNRQNVAEALAATSRSQNQTPVETQTPSASIAPWARDLSEAPKGPSLKEIQEAEARSAAQREEMAAAARRAQLLAEQERLSQQAQQSAPALPATANWASNASGTSGANAWNKAAGGKNGPTKTLAQIQKEEEARKQRLAAANAASQAASGSPVGTVAGKRYADLASKGATTQAAPAAPTSSTASGGGGVWTTIGAGGGKPKPPPATPVAPRSASAAAATPQTANKATRPAAASRTATTGNTSTSNTNQAIEELAKWAKLSLGRGLNSNINVDDFVQQLLQLPAETEIISDSIYANSQTLDGRRFAEEFIRRRKLADKGIVESVNVAAFGGDARNQGNNSGGWSEVAKKGSSNAAARDDDHNNAPFKVVTKKKGRR
ncbi:hypothetical protein VTN49DRAFT_1053 [Thermomyces lanuginosus]|uniref:uncharacterized protein n=1 Tax=Thermomyces lanuginosus TaxID=5541 RepID=UPI0037424E60